MLKTDRTPQPREIEAMRRMIKDRGGYLYYLAKASQESDPNWEAAFRKALTQYGCMRFCVSFSNVQGLDDFAQTYLTPETKKIFDSDIIERDENHLVIKAGYCPLMHAWVDCGGDDVFVAKLCDIAMYGDRAMVNSIPVLDFSLQKSLAFGDEQCEFLVELSKQEEEK